MGFFEKLKNGLNKTKTSFDEKMNNVFSNFKFELFVRNSIKLYLVVYKLK